MKNTKKNQQLVETIAWICSDYRFRLNSETAEGRIILLGANSTDPNSQDAKLVFDDDEDGYIQVGVNVACPSCNNINTVRRFAVDVEMACRLASDIRSALLGAGFTSFK